MKGRSGGLLPGDVDVDGCDSGSLSLLLVTSIVQVQAAYPGQRYFIVGSFRNGGGALHRLHFPRHRWMYAVSGGDPGGVCGWGAVGPGTVATEGGGGCDTEVLLGWC